MQLTIGKLADVEYRIADLARVREGLALLIAACPGHGKAENCILRAPAHPRWARRT